MAGHREKQPGGEAERYRDKGDRGRQRVSVAVWSRGSSVQVSWAVGPRLSRPHLPGGTKRELSSN